MNYKFPEIESISDVKKHVDGFGSIKVMDRDDYTVIDYVFYEDGVFDGEGKEYRRECRGLVFDNKGKLISRPYHKFFNLNEKEEVSLANVDFGKRHYVMQKADGSMVRPVMFGSGFRFMTRKGITKIAMDAETFLMGKGHEYVKWVMGMLEDGYTPIFEWVSPFNQIVVRYDYPSLILTGVRHMNTGEYLDMKDIVSPFPIVGFRDGGDDTSLFLNDVYDDKDYEGVVVRFDDGHMLKVKTKWYVDIHNVKDKIRDVYGVLNVHISGSMDDLLPFLDKDDRGRVSYIVHCYNIVRDEIFSEVCGIYEKYSLMDDGRVKFALSEYSDGFLRHMVFSLFNGKNIVNTFKEIILKNKRFYNEFFLPRLLKRFPELENDIKG